jgi:hypothetical protein
MKKSGKEEVGGMWSGGGRDENPRAGESKRAAQIDILGGQAGGRGLRIRKCVDWDLEVRGKRGER